LSGSEAIETATTLAATRQNTKLELIFTQNYETKTEGFTAEIVIVTNHNNISGPSLAGQFI